MLAVFPVAARAQVSTNASVTGHVTDESGALIPGVAVTATSPALQVREVSTLTVEDGTYTLRDLPAPGVYKISYSFAGFQTYVREAITLSVGFSARLDVVMKPGEVSETVDVVGSNPVIDTVDTAAGTNLQYEELRLIPRGSTMQELLPMIPGVSMTGKPDVGDSNLAARSTVVTYGVILSPTLSMEGINMTSGRQINTAMYFSGYNLGEAEFKTIGNNADVAFPGVYQETVIKSGSNSFHGLVAGNGEKPAFQANNITPTLAAQGLKFTNPMKEYYDYEADLGGRIIRDKLWFYGAVSKQDSIVGQIGFVSGPDAAGCWTCGDAPPANVKTSLPQQTIKASYQALSSLKLIGVYVHALKYLSAQNASSTTPLPSSTVQHQTMTFWKGEVQWVPTPNLLIDAMSGFAGYVVNYTPEPGMDKPGQPSSQELSTNLLTGPNSSPQNRPALRHQTRGSVSYTRGKHSLKVGTDDSWEESDTKVLADQQHGDDLLIFNKGVPSQVQLFNYPVLPHNSMRNQALYVADTWRLGRVTLNYGLRWERYHAFYPDQQKPAGQFSAATTYPGADLLTWRDTVPRFGAAWDVFGKGKTVLKGSFAKFGNTMGYDFAGIYNPNAIVTTTYKWSGPCVPTGFNNVSFNNTSCDISPATLATLNPASPNFISAIGGLNNLNNPNLPQDKIYEYAATVEQEVAPNVSVGASYVHHRVYYLYQSLEPTTVSTANGVNILRPYSVYTVPVTLADSFNGNPVTLYTYPAAYASSAYNRNELMGAPGDRHDTFHSISFQVTKRYSKRWNGMASFWVTKNHEWIQAVSPSPNADAFPIDNTWNWEARGSVSYNAPLGIVVSGLYRAQSGIYGQRTENFANPLLLQGSVTLRMEPFGSQQGPMISVANLEVGKEFGLGESRKLKVNFATYNLFNTSAATSTSYLTGPTYLRTTGIVSPRVARLGLEFRY